MAVPKKPGRKPGEGVFSYRQPPKPEDVTRTLDAPLASTHCRCGGEWEVTFETASVTDLPPVSKPDVSLFRVAVGHCKRCHRVERGVHPQLAPSQFGATAHRVGERAKATAHGMHYGAGIPVRKTPLVLKC